MLVDIRGCDLRSGRLGQSEATTAGASSGKLASTRSGEEDIGGRLLHTESFRSWKDLEEIKPSWAACIPGVKTLSGVQVTSGFLIGVYDTLTSEQTQPQDD